MHFLRKITTLVNRNIKLWTKTALGFLPSPAQTPADGGQWRFYTVGLTREEDSKLLQILSAICFLSLIDFLVGLKSLFHSMFKVPSMILDHNAVTPLKTNCSPDLNIRPVKTYLYIIKQSRSLQPAQLALYILRQISGIWRKARHRHRHGRHPTLGTGWAVELETKVIRSFAKNSQSLY